MFTVQYLAIERSFLERYINNVYQTSTNTAVFNMVARKKDMVTTGIHDVRDDLEDGLLDSWMAFRCIQSILEVLTDLHNPGFNFSIDFLLEQSISKAAERFWYHQGGRCLLPRELICLLARPSTPIGPGTQWSITFVLLPACSVSVSVPIILRM